MIFLRLFYEFFKTGLFAVGGGMATIPFLYNMGETTGWFTAEDVSNMIAVGESTPGPIGVNMATYVGFEVGKPLGLPGALLGALVATLGLVAPSIIIILVIARFLQSYRHSPLVESVFYGLRPASTGLVASAGIAVMAKELLIPAAAAGGLTLALFNWKGIVLAVLLWICTNKVKAAKGLHPILFILASAVAGVIFKL